MRSIQSIQNDSWATALGSLGEALFIAGFLGFTADRVLKDRLVVKVAEGALRSQWGVNAPQEYIENLAKSITGYRQINLSREMHIELSWYGESRGKFLQLKITSWYITQNISGEEPQIVTAPEFVIPLTRVQGVPDVSIDSFELMVWRLTGQRRVPIEEHQSWNESALQKVYSRTSEGGLKLNKDAENDLSVSVPPGAICESRVTSIVYCKAEDELDISAKSPTLSWKLDIGGPAASDLSVVTRMAGSDMDGDGEHDFPRTCGFTHAGAVMQVRWVPKKP